MIPMDEIDEAVQDKFISLYMIKRLLGIRAPKMHDDFHAMLSLKLEELYEWCSDNNMSHNPFDWTEEQQTAFRMVWL